MTFLLGALLLAKLGWQSAQDRRIRLRFLHGLGKPPRRMR